MIALVAVNHSAEIGNFANSIPLNRQFARVFIGKFQVAFKSLRVTVFVPKERDVSNRRPTQWHGTGGYGCPHSTKAP
jgi:hypothetical protein